MPPPKPPALSPQRGVQILEDLIRQGEALRYEHRHSAKITEWAEAAEQALVAALGSQHDTVQSFAAEFHSGLFYLHDSEARLQQQFLKSLDDSLSVLKSAVMQLR
jgi:uncharacterized protein (DUF1501 family)